MTRPKYLNKRRAILDLSYTKGLSVNDHVNRYAFDEENFHLTVLQLIFIFSDILDPFKVDVARTFRNLLQEPSNCIKFVIKWNGKWYLDKKIMFGLVHGTAVFQLRSDTIEKCVKPSWIFMNQINAVFRLTRSKNSFVRQFLPGSGLVYSLPTTFFFFFFYIFFLFFKKYHIQTSIIH